MHDHLTNPAAAYSDKERMLRFVSETHFLLKLGVELSLDKHLFYNSEIGDLTDGKLVVQMFEKLDNFGQTGMLVKEFMFDAFNVRAKAGYNERVNAIVAPPIVSAYPNYLLSTMPYTRAFRDASALADVYATSSLLSAEERGQYHKVPYQYRLLDALTGIRILQVDPALREAVYEARKQRIRLQMQEDMGVSISSRPFVEEAE